MCSDPTGKWAISIGSFASLLCIGGLSYGISLSIDDNWNVGLQVTEANILKKRSGGVFGFLSFGVENKVSLSTNADTIYDLEGESYSVSAIGYEVSTSNLDNLNEGINTFSWSNSYSIAESPIVASASQTKTICSVNAGSWLENAWRKVKSWFW